MGDGETTKTQGRMGMSSSLCLDVFSFSSLSIFGAPQIALDFRRPAAVSVSTVTSTTADDDDRVRTRLSGDRGIRWRPPEEKAEPTRPGAVSVASRGEI